MVDFFIGFWIFYECVDNCPEGFFVGFVSGECLKKKWDPVLVCCYTKNKSLEIPSPIFWISVSDLDLFSIGVRFVFSRYTEIGVSTLMQCEPNSVGSKHSAMISLNNSVGP